MNNTEKEETITSLRKFFSKWFYISIILLLAGLIASDVPSDPINHPFLSYLLHLCASLLKDTGVAIFVANIFTFVIGTEEFFSYIREKLVRIIVSKDFVTTLGADERKELLKMVLKPTNELSVIYSRISDYFNRYIDNSMQLFHGAYRSNLVISATAKYDATKKQIYVEEDINYRVYRIDNKFESLPLGFEKTESRHIETRIVAPNGDEETFNEEKLKPRDGEEDISLAKSYILTIPETFNQHHHLMIYRRVIEYGEDHWILFSYKTIYPCDGLDITITCNDEIKVRNFVTYGTGPKFTVRQFANKIRITCDDWIRPGFGVCVVLSRDCITYCQHMPSKNVPLIAQSNNLIKS